MTKPVPQPEKCFYCQHPTWPWECKDCGKDAPVTNVCRGCHVHTKMSHGNPGTRRRVLDDTSPWSDNAVRDLEDNR